jgi:hypothetical protein
MSVTGWRLAKTGARRSGGAPLRLTTPSRSLFRHRVTGCGWGRVGNVSLEVGGLCPAAGPASDKRENFS